MKKRLLFFILILFFIFIFRIGLSNPNLCHSSSHESIVKGEMAEKLDEYLGRIVLFGFSGAILVAKNGEVLIDKGYGLAIRDKNIPNTPETIFCSGSVTKQFTAAAIMKLEMMGKLKTDDPLSKYISDVPVDKQKITLHHLLTHTSGIGGDVGGDYEIAPRDETAKKILAQSLRSEPGKEFFYSNAGYSLLAAVLEKASGRSYEEFLHENLFKPAGMLNTGYRIPDWEKKIVAHWYVGDKDNGVPLDKPFPYWNLLGNGGILSTTGDMFSWNRALKGENILSSEAKKKLWTPFLNDYAYGWDVIKTEHGTLIQHDGSSSLGNSFDFRWFVEPDILIALFCNQSEDGSAMIFKLRDKVEKIVFNGKVEIPPLLKPGEPKRLAKYTGNYEFPAGAKFKITQGEGGLFIEGKGQEAMCLLLGVEDGPKFKEWNERAAVLVEKSSKGDHEAVYQAFGGRIPLERIKEREKMMWEESKAQFGNFKGFEVLGSIPFENRTRTFVVFHFDRESTNIEYIWGEKGLMGIRIPATPVKSKFLPQTETEFVGYNLGLARVMRIKFQMDEKGEIKGVVHSSKTGAFLARKVS